VGSEKSGPPRKYEIGQKFGRWTLVARLGYQGGSHSMGRVKCECGATHDVVATNVTSGTSTQCASCAGKEKAKKRGWKK